MSCASKRVLQNFFSRMYIMPRPLAFNRMSRRGTVGSRNCVHIHTHTHRHIHHATQPAVVASPSPTAGGFVPAGTTNPLWSIKWTAGGVSHTDYGDFYQIQSTPGGKGSVYAKGMSFGSSGATCVGQLEFSKDNSDDMSSYFQFKIRNKDGTQSLTYAIRFGVTCGEVMVAQAIGPSGENFWGVKATSTPMEPYNAGILITCPPASSYWPSQLANMVFEIKPRGGLTTRYATTAACVGAPASTTPTDPGYIYGYLDQNACFYAAGLHPPGACSEKDMVPSSLGKFYQLAVMLHVPQFPVETTNYIGNFYAVDKTGAATDVVYAKGLQFDDAACGCPSQCWGENSWELWFDKPGPDGYSIDKAFSWGGMDWMMRVKIRVCTPCSGHAPYATLEQVDVRMKKFVPQSPLVMFTWTKEDFTTTPVLDDSKTQIGVSVSMPKHKPVVPPEVPPMAANSIVLKITPTSLKRFVRTPPQISGGPSTCVLQKDVSLAPYNYLTSEACSWTGVWMPGPPGNWPINVPGLPTQAWDLVSYGGQEPRTAAGGWPTVPIAVQSLWTNRQQKASSLPGVQTLWYWGVLNPYSASADNNKQWYTSLFTKAADGKYNPLPLWAVHNCADTGAFFIYDAVAKTWGARTISVGLFGRGPGQECNIPLPGLSIAGNTGMTCFLGYVRYYNQVSYDGLPTLCSTAGGVNVCELADANTTCQLDASDAGLPFIYGTLGVEGGQKNFWQWEPNPSPIVWNWIARDLDPASAVGLEKPGTVARQLPITVWDKLTDDPNKAIRMYTDVFAYPGSQKRSTATGLYDLKDPETGAFTTSVGWSGSEYVWPNTFVYPMAVAFAEINPTTAKGPYPAPGGQVTPITWSAFSSIDESGVSQNGWYSSQRLWPDGKPHKLRPAYNLLLRFSFTFLRGSHPANEPIFGFSIPGVGLLGGAVCLGDHPFVLGPRPYANDPVHNPFPIQPGGPRVPQDVGYERYLTCGKAVMTVDSREHTCVYLAAFHVHNGPPMLVLTDRECNPVPIATASPDAVITLSGIATIPMVMGAAIHGKPPVTTPLPVTIPATCPTGV